MMQEVSPEECKKLQLNILLSVAKFCDEHKIKYSLAYGTLIGAIRHKGFIPWDDDIDIIMMREDYEKFVATYKDEKYVLIHGENLANHLHVVISDLSTRLIFHYSPSDSFFYKGGLWVDIFPIDKVPENNKAFRIMVKILFFLKNLHRLSQFTPRKEMYMKAAHYIISPFEGLLNKCMLGMMCILKKSKSQTVADLALCYLPYPSFPLRLMDEYIDVDFEGHKFKSIKGYDEFLKGIYGDYMKLPPIEEQVARHGYTAYYRK